LLWTAHVELPGWAISLHRRPLAVDALHGRDSAWDWAGSATGASSANWAVIAANSSVSASSRGRTASRGWAAPDGCEVSGDWAASLGGWRASCG